MRDYSSLNLQNKSDYVLCAAYIIERHCRTIYGEEHKYNRKHNFVILAKSVEDSLEMVVTEMDRLKKSSITMHSWETMEFKMVVIPDGVYIGDVILNLQNEEFQFLNS